MGLFDRIIRLIRANINETVRKSEDPEQLLEQLVMSSQENVVQLRQSVSSAISTQQRSEQQYDKAMQNFKKWRTAAQSASEEGDEELSKRAITRAAEHAKIADIIKNNLDEQREPVEVIKRSLVKMESEFSVTKARMNLLKLRSTAAQSQEQHQQIIAQTSQLLTDREQSIDKSEADGLYWQKTKSRIQAGLAQLPQMLAEAVANQELLQGQYEQAIQHESGWQQKAQTAAERGDQNLLAEALARKKVCNKTIAIKKTQLDAQGVIVGLLRQYLILLESQIAECQGNIDRTNTPTA